MRLRKCLILAGIIMLSIFMLISCSDSQDKNAIADYADQKITISGLTDEDFTVTVADLAALDSVERSASAERSNGEKVSIDAVGPLLDTFLAKYSKSQSDFTSIRFTAADKYSIAVGSQVLQNREIVLAVSDGGNALSEDDQPLRVVIPGERAMYWVRHICRIDFVSGETASQCRNMVFLESAVKTLKSSDYDYNGVTDKVIADSDLLDKYASEENADTLTLTAADGLTKSETADNFRSGMLKYTGADAPRFVADQLPEGMQIYDLVTISYGETSILTLDKLISLYGNKDGVEFFDVTKKINGVSAEKYICRCLDGSSVTLTVDDLQDAVLYLDDQGRVVLKPASGEPIVDLLQVEAK